MYKIFIDIYPELEKLASYTKFLKTFNEYNISIRPLKVDVCSVCDSFDSQIRASTQLKDKEQINSLKISKSEHLKEAENFYNKLKELKSKFKNDKTQAILCIDYQKNMSLLDTKRNIEYYLRKLSIQNFCIYDEKSFKAKMFPYAEHFALKGANEVISSIDFYLKNILNKETKILHLFCDNAFGQNKNRFLWSYFLSIIKSGLLDNIIIYYPIPGHSRLSCDRAFALIEKKILVNEKIYSPTHYVNILKNSNIKNPYKIVYLNFPLTDDLKPDNNMIAKVYDYKKCYEKILKTKLDYCSDVRLIRFSVNNCEISLNINEPKFLSLTLFKKNFDINSLDEKTKSVTLAYNKMLSISREKLYDANKLIESLHLPQNIIFFQSLYSDQKASEISKSKKLLYKHMKLNV